MLDKEMVALEMLEDMMKLKGRAVPHYLKEFSYNFKSDSKLGSSGFNKRQV